MVKWGYFRIAHNPFRTEKNVDLYVCVPHAELEFIDSFASGLSFGNPCGSFLSFESSAGLIRFNSIPRIQILEVS
jgi:hypothetical protein